MRWSVAVAAEGDRELTREEVVELADAVAAYSGIASGIGTSTPGVQLVVEASTEADALSRGTELFEAAVARAGLPAWPVIRLEAISEADEEAAETAGEYASDYVEFR